MFEWTSIQPVVDGWIARLSLSVPIIGWLIVFNDSVGGQLTFEVLGGVKSIGQVDLLRLRFIYFGLIFLGGANLLYRLFRPRLIANYHQIDHYIDRGFETHSYNSMVQLYNEVSVWNAPGYSKLELGEAWGSYDKESKKNQEAFNSHSRSSILEYSVIKERFAPLIRSVLHFNYAKQNRSRVFAKLIICILALVGYVLLLIPSFSVLTQVLTSTMKLL